MKQWFGSFIWNRIKNIQVARHSMQKLIWKTNGDLSTRSMSSIPETTSNYDNSCGTSLDLSSGTRIAAAAAAVQLLGGKPVPTPSPTPVYNKHIHSRRTEDWVAQLAEQRNTWHLVGVSSAIKPLCSDCSWCCCCCCCCCYCQLHSEIATAYYSALGGR